MGRASRACKGIVAGPLASGAGAADQEATGREPPSPPTGLSKDWITFLDPVPTKAECASLSALGRWASVAGMTPAQMSDPALARFCAEEAATRLSGHAEAPARTLARASRHAVAAQPEGVALPLLRAPKRRSPYMLTREQLPRSFVEELDAHAASLGGTSASRRRR